jgi:peptidoglycan/xylan/chitin deacetylase (PgdA/CDA1 family)
MAVRRNLIPGALLVLVLAVGLFAARSLLSDDGTRAVALTGPIAATDQIESQATAFVASAPAPPRRQAPSRWSLTDAATASIPDRDAVVAAGSAKRAVALTFDDGPSDYTSSMLAALARYRAHATFFVIGRSARARPSLLRAIVAAGDEIGNHSWSHSVLRSLAPGTQRDEVLTTSGAIDGNVPATTTLMRPPYGSTDAAVNALTRSLGLVPVIWSVDTRDWTGLTAEKIAARVLSAVKPGSIILMHDGGGDRSATVAALDLIIPALRKRHYRFATVSALLNASPPGPDQLAHGS